MKKIAFLFPGQGSQYPGMGVGKCRGSEIVEEVFREANYILGYDLSKMILEGSAEELADTEFTQPAVFVTSYALYKYYKEQLPVTHFMAGHSLGEYTALVCAGALRFRDALRLVQQRARLMKKTGEKVRGAMVAVNRLDEERVVQICASVAEKGGEVSIAAFNSATQFVLAGREEAVEEAGSLCEAAGGSVVRLRVSAPFHCALMQEAADALGLELRKYAYLSPRCGLLSNVTGAPYGGDHDIAGMLQWQMTLPVKWRQSMDRLVEEGVRIFIEIGPGKVLRNLLKGREGIRIYSVDDEKDAVELVGMLAAELPTLSTVVTRSLGIAMSIRNFNEDAVAYQEGVVQPYRAIKSIQARLEAERVLPGREVIAETMSHFCTILNAKRLAQSERLGWLRYLCQQTGTEDLFPVYAEKLEDA